MTQKELAYFEDAVSHEDVIISVLEETINNLEDEDLVTFMEEQVSNHSSIKERLMDLLEEKTNE